MIYVNLMQVHLFKMSDLKITQLNEAVGMSDSDLFPIVSDPSGSTETKKITKEHALDNSTINSPTINTGVSGTAISTSATLTEKSDTILASQKAVRSYVNNTNVVTVGTSASTTPSDFICDGTADDVQIQAAIDSLTAGRTWIEEVKCKGNFNISAKITIPSYTKISGGNFALVSGVNDDMFYAGGTEAGQPDYTQAASFIVFNDVRIDGNSSGQTTGYGIHFYNVYRWWILNSYTTNCKLAGIYLEGDDITHITGDGFIDKTLTESNTEDGLKGWFASVNDINLYSRGNGGNGIALYNSQQNTIRGSYRDNTDNNILISTNAGYSGNIIDGVISSSGLVGVRIYGSDENVIMGGSIIQCTNQAVLIGGSRNIVSNVFGSGNGYTIDEEAGSDYNTYTGNILYNNTNPATFQGVNNVYNGNQGIGH